VTEAPYRPTEARYRPETGCAASAGRRGDLLAASAPPAERWLLIECRDAWPRDALTALHRSEPPFNKGDSAAAEGLRGVRRAGGDGADELGAQVARLCAAMGYRPALIRRYGRHDRNAPRRWALVDSRPGQESIRWGELHGDEHLLDVLAGKDQGTPSTEPIYLVCTHGRHDACCAVWGRPAAAALAAAYPDRTWECSHVGGDRFAPNVVLLPHSLFYGHVPPSRVVELASRYEEGLIVPEFFRGSGAFPPHIQAAQHFARTAGYSLAVDALRPIAIHQLAPNIWHVRLATHPQTQLPPQAATGRRDHAPGVLPSPTANVPPDQAANQSSVDVITVEVAAHLVTIDGAMTCASKPPGRVRQFTLISQIQAA
jgi:hypothetical protein